MEQGEYIVVGRDQKDKVSGRRKTTAYRISIIVKIT